MLNDKFLFINAKVVLIYKHKSWTSNSFPWASPLIGKSGRKSASTRGTFNSGFSGVLVTLSISSWDLPLVNLPDPLLLFRTRSGLVTCKNWYNNKIKQHTTEIWSFQSMIELKNKILNPQLKHWVVHNRHV